MSHAARCSESSLAAREPLAGTAVEARYWVCFEYRGTWSEKGYPDIELPEAARAALRAQRARGARIQLLRRPQRREGPLRVLFADVARATTAGFLIEDLAELAGLPWEALWAGSPPEEARLHNPTFLVCTHGRRDRCCALAGPAVYLTLQAAIAVATATDGPAAELWQTTHLGGHRFAPTLLALPHGICYGRFLPEDAALLLAAHRLGRAWGLPSWRGRCAWPPPAQLAEIHLRQQIESPLSFDALQLLDCQPRGPDAWQVRLAGPDGEPWQVEVVREDLAEPVRKSCGDEVPTPGRALRVTSVGGVSR